MAVTPTTSYIVAAIPSKDCYVWNLSSEKVPHLTIMYLDGAMENLGDVEKFLEHTVNTSMRKFWLDVDRRGELGDKSADVLFFKKWGIKDLERFRTYLLGNDNISKAYHSVEQFPEWTPHLTLGYPETPAKPDDRDYPSLSAVWFDRIALWTDDYEGVEFPLPSYDDVLAQSMSDKGKEYLEHFGVKGMKWGIRRENPTVSSATEAKLKKMQARENVRTINDKIRRKKLVDLNASKDHRDAKFVRTKAKVSGVSSLSNQDLQKVIARMNLERNFHDLKKIEHERSLIGAGKKWVGHLLTDILRDAGSSWIKRPGSNFTGQTSARARAIVVGNQFANSIELPPRALGQ